MIRIFKQNAKGYGSGTLSANVQMDGQVIFDGPVPTVAGPVPGEVPGTVLGVDCWQWNETDHTWTGTRNLTITVQGSGVLQLNETLAVANVANAIASDNWTSPYLEEISTPAGNIIYGDPMSDVMIDGVTQFNHRAHIADTGLGQWGWNIMGGQTLTATFTCNRPAQP